MFSNQFQNATYTTRDQRDHLHEIWERSLQYFLRSSDNKLQMSKSKMAACRPFCFPIGPNMQYETTRDQGEPACEIWERSLQYFLRSSDNKLQISKSKMATCRPCCYPIGPNMQYETTKDQGEPACEIWEISLQYFLRSSDNKLQMSKFKMAARRPYCFPIGLKMLNETTRDQGAPACEIWVTKIPSVLSEQ